MVTSFDHPLMCFQWHFELEEMLLHSSTSQHPHEMEHHPISSKRKQDFQIWSRNSSMCNIKEIYVGAHTFSLNNNYFKKMCFFFEKLIPTNMLESLVSKFYKVN